MNRSMLYYLCFLVSKNSIRTPLTQPLKKLSITRNICKLQSVLRPSDSGDPNSTLEIITESPEKINVDCTSTATDRTEVRSLKQYIALFV